MSTPTDQSASTDRWRDQLVERGFVDDGVRLRGRVAWTHPTFGRTTARVEIEPDDRFPFAPPPVRVLDPGSELDVTFHIDRPARPGASGNLCLWGDDWPVDQAPWRGPDRLLERIADWLEQTAAGWPNDDICDLERYLEPDSEILVLYDADELAALAGAAVRTTPGPTQAAIVVTNEIRRIRGFLNDQRRQRRKDRRLTWIDDLGAITRPVRSWRDIEAALGDRAAELKRAIAIGAVELLLLRYQRGMRNSVLAVKVRRIAGDIELKACESADTSSATRGLRAGPLAAELATVKVAIVGCGAVGSFAADLLFRSGIRRLTLLDHERLRPGNVVRHLAGVGHEGEFKVVAVRDCLAAIGARTHGICVGPWAVATLEDALALVQEHDVVLDATGNARASGLLATAAAIIGADTGHAVVSACVQREGDIVRIDRLPPRRGENYLPALPTIDDADEQPERGCASPVSRTPPGAVVAAAELACRVVIDEATRKCTFPATLVDVRRAQPEPPYDRVGLLSSQSPQLLAEAS